jgi:hypothetical protein
MRGTKQRIVQERKVRESCFTPDKQALFLAHFAATCNLTESAKLAGVGRRVVYCARVRDEAFRQAFAVAEENGIISLRAEMARRSMQLLDAVTPEEKALAALPGLDCNTILHLLKYHEKGAGKGPGDRQPQRSDPNEAAARLQKLLVRMRAEHKRELALKRAARAQAGVRS